MSSKNCKRQVESWQRNRNFSKKYKANRLHDYTNKLQVRCFSPSQILIFVRYLIFNMFCLIIVTEKKSLRDLTTIMDIMMVSLKKRS